MPRGETGQKAARDSKVVFRPVPLFCVRGPGRTNWLAAQDVRRCYPSGQKWHWPQRDLGGKVTTILPRLAKKAITS
jgi:hypothetical protein